MKTSSPHPLVEILLGLAPVLTIMWVTPLVVEDRATFLRVNFSLSLVTFAVALMSNIVHGDTLKEIGLRVDNLGRALRLLALPTAGAALLILAAGLAFGSVNLGDRFFFHLKSLPLWTLAQQYALQGFLHRRVQDLCGKGWKSILWVAAIFSALHLPNPMLTVGTFLGGALWAWTFQREPNLLALMVSHTLLSAVLANSLPPWILPNMKVGWGYWG